MRAILIGLASLLLVTCVFAAEQPNLADSVFVDEAATVVDQEVTESAAESGCDAAKTDVLTNVLGFEPSLTMDQDKTQTSGGSCTQSCVNSCAAANAACKASCGSNYSCLIDCNCALYWCVDDCGCAQDGPPILC